MESLGGQLQAFLYTIGAGLLLGLMFDLYRVLRGLTRPNGWITFLTDLLFWVAATPALFAVLLVANWGALRFYVFIGVGLGLFLYYQIISPGVIWAATSLTRWLVGLVLGALGLLAGLALWPIGLLQRVRFRSVGGWGIGLRPRGSGLRPGPGPGPANPPLWAPGALRRMAWARPRLWFGPR